MEQTLFTYHYPLFTGLIRTLHTSRLSDYILYLSFWLISMFIYISLLPGVPPVAFAADLQYVPAVCGSTD